MKRADQALLDRALGEIERLRGFFGLNGWMIDAALEEFPDRDGAKIHAETHWPTGYRQARIDFDREFLTDAPNIALERVVAHELGHLVCAPFSDLVVELVGGEEVGRKLAAGLEAVIDTYTNLLMHARDGRAHIHTKRR